MTIWTGSTACQLCEKGLVDEPLIDGRLQIGPWAVMCEECHATAGRGLGIGYGQKYAAPDADGNRIKVEG